MIPAIVLKTVTAENEHAPEGTSHTITLLAVGFVVDARAGDVVRATSYLVEEIVRPFYTTAGGDRKYTGKTGEGTHADFRDLEDALRHLGLLKEERTSLLP